jgi:exodeoxyribonuclease VII large subunit
MQQQSLTVSLLTSFIRELLEEQFSTIKVIGEVSNYKYHSSGHRYFTLKDENAQIKAVMWRSRQPGFELRDGMKVYVVGRLSVYPAQGSYQLDCTSITPAGTGDLYIAFEQLKQELQQAGYFEQSRKRRIPVLPMKVGVATSPTGAALQDILSTMKRRFPACEVVVRPTLVQGDGSANDIANAIRDLSNYNPDVIIIGRGGGSIEDLWSFNTKIVADAIYHSRIPIISAVGHETDFTISDFVADIRAATPTSAAELCTPARTTDIQYALDLRIDALSSLITSIIDLRKSTVLSVLEGAFQTTVLHNIQTKRQDINYLQKSSLVALNNVLSSYKQELKLRETSLQLSHPLSPLERGFAMISDSFGVPISIDQELTAGSEILIQRKIEKRIVKVL